jgi:hypothetical protein
MMPRSNRYYDDRQRFYQEREDQRRQFEDPAKQAEYDQQYNAETDELFKSLVKEIVGSGTDEPSSYDRSKAGMESLENDTQLRYQLGYSYKKPKSDKRPDGAYAMADYPYLHHAIWAAKGGLPPAQMSGGVIPGSKKDLELQEQRKRWAAAQEAMLNKDGFWNHYDR